MNSKSFRLIGSDWFALFQVAMAWAFVWPQIQRMRESVQGVTINWLLCAFLFIALNLSLTIASLIRERTRGGWQQAAIYGNWFLLLIPTLWIMRERCAWTKQDTLIFSLIMASAVGLLIWGKSTGRGLKDPVIRGLLVGLFRVVPHIYMCYVFVSTGGSSGIPKMTVFSANVTALARIATLINSGRKSALRTKDGRWDGTIKSTFLSECANEGSWAITTAFWFAYL